MIIIDNCSSCGLTDANPQKGTVNNALSGEYVKTNDELRTTNEEQFRKALLRISTVPRNLSSLVDT